jgi:hypothetical protein
MSVMRKVQVLGRYMRGKASSNHQVAWLLKWHQAPGARWMGVAEVGSKVKGSAPTVSRQTASTSGALLQRSCWMGD